MRVNAAEIRQTRRVTIFRAVFGTSLLFVAAQVHAADHFVSSGTSTVNCGTFGSGVKPGDTITLAAGNRGPLTIRNCKGQSGNPIVVRNDVTGSGPTIIRRSTAGSGGFVFACRDCVDVVIDGTGKWKGAPQGAYCGAPAGTNGCGIKVTSVAANDSPSAYLKLNGLSTKVTVRGIAIDGRMADLKTWGIGIDLNDHAIKAGDHPGFWREDFIFEKNYVRYVNGEGMYIGPNWLEPDLDIPLRNMTIRENLVEDTGRNGMTLKSAIGGTNRIHDNVVRRSGLRREGTRHGSGITAFEGGRNLKIYRNWVEGAGVQGIQHYNMNLPASQGTFSSEIFNNVVYDSGKGGASSNCHGITVGSKDGAAEIVPSVYNNTIVKAVHAGINFNTQVTRGVVRNNIIAEWGTSALSVGKSTSSNNRTGTIASMKFVNAGSLEFALSSDSPARDAASSTGFPENDFLLIPRPQGGNADQGAFEFSTAAAAPRAPDITDVK